MSTRIPGPFQQSCYPVSPQTQPDPGVRQVQGSACVLIETLKPVFCKGINDMEGFHFSA